MFCKKCNSVATVTLRKKDTYCEECFSLSTNHKFRSCLGKNRVLSHDDTVLLGISGGKGSMALLDLVHNGISLDTHKKLKVRAICLHLCGLNQDQKQEIIIAQKLIEVCKLCSFDLFIVNISQYFEKELCMPVVNTLSELQTERNVALKSLEQNLRPTELNDLITKIIRKLFIRVGKTLKCNKIFTAETTTTLASNLLSNIALGRGSQVEHDIGFSDSRDKHVKILRPMKDISMEELMYYIKIKKICVPEQGNDTDSNNLQSVIKLFVMNLQDNFQSTISTVCKTADKIGIGTCDDLTREFFCQICQSGISANNNKQKLTALEATNYSKALCNGIVKHDSILISTPNNVVQQHCYGCMRSNKLK